MAEKDVLSESPKLKKAKTETYFGWKTSAETEPKQYSVDH